MIVVHQTIIQSYSYADCRQECELQIKTTDKARLVCCFCMLLFNVLELFITQIEQAVCEKYFNTCVCIVNNNNKYEYSFGYNGSFTFTLV